jgi:hypothetical protein
MIFGNSYESVLEEYVVLSNQYPHRLQFHVVENIDIPHIMKICFSQLGYVYTAKHPFLAARQFFFESQEDATMMKMAIGGTYNFQEIE